MVEYVIFSWAQTDPRSAWQWLDHLDRKDQRASMAGDILGFWIANDPREALEVILALPPGPQRDSFIGKYQHSVGQRDPQMALAVLPRLPEVAQAPGLTTIATTLAGSDPSAALAIVEKLPKPGDRAAGLRSVIDRWAENDPGAAAEYAVTHAHFSASELNVQLQSLVSRWTSSDASAAADWVRGLKDDNLRGPLLRDVAINLVQHDPRKAVTLLPDIPEPERTSAVGNMAARWVGEDWEGAANWVLTLPEGPSRARAIGTVTASLAYANPGRFAAWIEQVPAGLSRDAAVVSFVDEAVRKNPEIALPWAETIGDARMRASVIERNVRRWLFKDPAAATQWIQDTPVLTPEAKQEIIRNGGSEGDTL
jgi:hypothetical protein